MTPDQLLTALTESSATARAVLSLMAAYPTAGTDLSVTVGGVTTVVEGLAKQRAALQVDRTADRVGAAMDLTGAIVSQTIGRDALRRISSVRSKLSSGYSIVMVYARTNQVISSISLTVEDALGNVVAGPAVRTIQRSTDGLYAGMN